MYIHMGSDMAVRESAVIGIFDLDNTSSSRHTRKFLRRAETDGAVVSVSDELPKAFVLTEEFGMERVYLTQIASRTIAGRIQESRRAGRQTDFSK